MVPTGQQRPSLDLQIDQVWPSNTGGARLKSEQGCELPQVRSLKLFLWGISHSQHMFLLLWTGTEQHGRHCSVSRYKTGFLSPRVWRIHWRNRTSRYKDKNGISSFTWAWCLQNTIQSVPNKQLLKPHVYLTEFLLNTGVGFNQHWHALHLKHKMFPNEYRIPCLCSLQISLHIKNN